MGHGLNLDDHRQGRGRQSHAAGKVHDNKKAADLYHHTIPPPVAG